MSAILILAAALIGIPAICAVAACMLSSQHSRREEAEQTAAQASQEPGE